MTDHLKKIINGRYIYFASLLGDDSETQSELRKFSDYLDIQHDYHVMNMFKKISSESAIINKNKKKRINKDNISMFVTNCMLSVCEQKTLEQFILSLDEVDSWEEQKLEYISKYEKLKSELEEEESSDERTKCKIRQKIDKKKAEAEMLEEIVKCLLMGVDNVDYLQEELRDISI